eukprot:2673053-Amphidinium_carterae.2
MTSWHSCHVMNLLIYVMELISPTTTRPMSYVAFLHYTGDVPPTRTAKGCRGELLSEHSEHVGSRHRKRQRRT